MPKRIVQPTIRYADQLESAGWGGCLRRQTSLGELGKLLGQLPLLLVTSLCAHVAAWRPSRSTLRFAKGGRGRFKVYVTFDLASLGPPNYETDFLISVADQLLKIRRVSLFWFCVLYWLYRERRRGFCTGLMLR